MYPHVTTGVPASFVGRDGRDIIGLQATADNGVPNLAFIYQPAISRLLRERIGESRIILGNEVVEVKQSQDGVIATADDGRQISSRWLLACDGAGSAVRRSLRIGFAGSRDEREWQVLDLDTRTGKEPEAAFRFLCSPGRPGVSTVLADGRYRLEWAGHEGMEEAVLLEAGLSEARVERRATYRHGHAVADCWQAGRVFFLGDAAHVLRPFAGQGISQGVRDAISVVWRLALAVRFDIDPPGGYEDERRPEVARAALVSNVAGAVVQARSELVATLRDHVLRLLVMPLLGGKISPDALLAPRRVRQGFLSARFRRGVGTRLPVQSLIDPRFVLVGCIPRDARSTSRFVAYRGEDGALQAALGSRPGIFLVRPDGVVFAGGELSELSRIIEDLELRLGERVKTS